MGHISCYETSLWNYHTTLCKNPRKSRFRDANYTSFKADRLLSNKQLKTYYLNNTCEQTLHPHVTSTSYKDRNQDKKKMPRQPTFSVIKHEVPLRRVLNSLYIRKKWGNVQRHERLLSSRYGFSWFLLLSQRECKLPTWKCRDGLSPAYTIPQLCVIFTNTIHRMNETGISVKFIL
jgi:hypothetical protein